MPSAEVISVNVGKVRTIAAGDAAYTTGIYKEPIAGRVSVAGVHVDGDEQADLSVHGGPDRALYAYASEDYAWWNRELARTLEPGMFGENLTLRGIDVNGARIGEQWRIGTATFRVTGPRVPCFKFAAKMGDPKFVKRFGAALRPGAYLAIDVPGEIGAGDAVTRTHHPTHPITVREMSRILLFEPERLPELLEARELPESWRTRVEERLGRRT